MAEKAILRFGEDILRKKAKPIEQVNERIVKLLDDLADTLYAAEGRAGLAAPQIGILRRAVVMDVGEGLVELLNPEILEASGEQLGLEGCLSLPGYYGRVQRAQYVKARTMTRDGKWRILEAEGHLARCIQHEVDHLDGILFIDHMTDSYLIHEGTKHRLPLIEAQKLAGRPIH